MYDPYNSPSSFDSPEAPPARNRSCILWASIAGVGALIMLALACGLLALFALPVFQEQIVTLGISPSAPAPPEAPDEAAIVVPPGPVNINEDFDQATMRWDQSSAQAVDGAYEVRIDTPNTDNYGLFLGYSSIQNFDMAADVQQVAGDATSEYGLRFRQSGPGDYLMFSLSGSGYYRLVRVADQQYTSLVPWTFDGRIKTGADAINRLRVVAQDESITGYINGAKVVDATDEVLAAGQLTLGLVTFEQGGLAVRFDNIEGEAEGNDLSEDFSNPEAVPWSIGGARIESGGYTIFAGGGIQSWQHPLPSGSSEVQNFVLEVEATLLDAGDEAMYGIIFGDGGSFDFYSLFILPDGGVTLLRQDSNGQAVLLEPIPLAAIEPGINATNTIRLEVRESHNLLISINGEELPELESAAPIDKGMAGLIVSSGSRGRVQVRFDNFRLEEIIEGEEV